jgi:hypothetical protein
VRNSNAGAKDMAQEEAQELIQNEQDKPWNYQDNVMDHNVRNVQSLIQSIVAMNVVYN